MNREMDDIQILSGGCQVTVASMSFRAVSVSQAVQPTFRGQTLLTADSENYPGSGVTPKKKLVHDRFAADCVVI